MNSSDFIPHKVNRNFIDGVPNIDYVAVIYRAITPSKRESKYYCVFWFNYNHNKHANRLDRINECLRKVANKRKPKLRKGYRWGKPKVMRVD